MSIFIHYLAKFFYLESKFIADDERHVTQYRRLVTSWFYISLKPISYEFRQKEVVCFFGVPMRFTGWVNKSKDCRLSEFNYKDKDLISYLNCCVSELKPTNVVRFKQ